MEIKKLNCESYSSVAVLLEKTVDNFGTLGVPYLVNDDGKLAIIVEKNGVYSVVSLSDSYIVSLDVNGRVDDLTHNKTVRYQILPDYFKPVVSKDDSSNYTYEQLFYERPDCVEFPFLNYCQMNSIGEECIYSFNLNDHRDNIPAFLNYLPNKSPYAITLKTYKRLVGRLIYKSMDRFVMNKNDSYSKDLFPYSKNISYLFKPVSYDEDSIFKVIESRKFNSCVNDELCEILNHNNQSINDIENLLDGYKKALKR